MEPGGVLLWFAAGLPLWLDGTPGTEAAAVAERIHHDGSGHFGSFWFGPVQRRAG